MILFFLKFKMLTLMPNMRFLFPYFRWFISCQCSTTLDLKLVLDASNCLGVFCVDFVILFFNNSTENQSYQIPSYPG